jgi:branched-chain amino acid transport system substrate-binding protein
MVATPILQYVQSKGLKRVGAIVADYAWGQAFKSAMEQAFASAPDVKLQIEVAPVGETDFTTYLRAFQSLKPQIIVATGHPPGSGPITVQSADLGFRVPVTGAYTPRSLVMKGAGNAAIDRYADFSCADFQSPQYQDLARRFLQFSPDSGFLEDDALAGYGIVKMVADTVGKVGDDPVEIAKYLHANSFDIPGYSFQMRWTEWGELANATIAFDVIGPGPAPEGLNKAGTWYPKRLLVSDPLQPYQPQ